MNAAAGEGRIPVKSMVTLVWLYIEILRLLSKLNRR
ncbi:MAG TPA: Bax inhibitor-1/YccA family protein [Phycisphaerae bacterium]|nr:Bax inhibitor-1/YccA family protein [Phycisphaerae bacterium]